MATNHTYSTVLRDLKNRGSDRLASDGTRGLLFKKPKCEAISEIRNRFEYKLNSEKLKRLKILIKAVGTGKSRYDHVKVFKIERSDSDEKFNTDRDF
ncbi:MAG: hypothetical protein ACXABI_14670 [Candidatus Hodarchaeales archaeon]|jgi:hypothetical protein